MSRGMSEGQKNRTRMYLDDFREKNGGCIICGRKISDFHFTPAEDNENPQLRIYGCCAGHGMLSNSDELLEAGVDKLLPEAQQIAQGKPVLVVITFKSHGEDIQYACTPIKKRGS